MSIKKYKRAYSDQKCHAKARGIEFQFTFDGWIKWWETNLGPDWFNLRGRYKGKYCMARHKDMGPYAAWNVDCILFEDNCVGSPKGKRGPRSALQHMPPRKLSDAEVVIIYYSARRQIELAVAYKISPRLVSLIKKKLARVGVTANL